MPGGALNSSGVQSRLLAGQSHLNGAMSRDPRRMPVAVTTAARVAGLLVVSRRTGAPLEVTCTDRLDDKVLARVADDGKGRTPPGHNVS